MAIDLFESWNWIQRPTKETAEESKKPLRLKMEGFQENIGQKCYLILMFPSSANGVVSRMPSPVGGDPLDYKTADSLMAKDQHGNIKELDQEAVPLILLLDYNLYKGEYVTRVCHSDCMRQTQYTDLH